MSASVKRMPGGQPSTTQPSAGPWLSPQVVTRKRWPKVLCDMNAVPARTTGAGVEAFYWRFLQWSNRGYRRCLVLHGRLAQWRGARSSDAHKYGARPTWSFHRLRSTIGWPPTNSRRRRSVQSGLEHRTGLDPGRPARAGRRGSHRSARGECASPTRRRRAAELRAGDRRILPVSIRTGWSSRPAPRRRCRSCSAWRRGRAAISSFHRRPFPPSRSWRRPGAWRQDLYAMRARTDFASRQPAFWRPSMRNTVLALVNSPHNPTGSVMPRAETEHWRPS